MIRYTNYPQELLVIDTDLTNSTCWVTYRQRVANNDDIVLTIQDANLTKSLIGADTLITVNALTQSQTAQFNDLDPFLDDGEAEVQVNWMDGSTRCATEIAKINIGRNLLEEVLS